jgi:hypothetical protein
MQSLLDAVQDLSTVCPLAVSAAIFITLDVYTPFAGVLKISDAPIRDALKHIGR